MIIPNMYHTKIQVYSDSGYTTPSYNINIDGTAYIKVKLFDFNGDPVVGESVTLYYDDATSIYTGTTNDSGEISTSYTCSEWGIHTFSTKTHICHIQVGNPYPVGSIYISINNTSPSLLFGGTWVQLTETFLYASTTSDSASTTATAGEKTHTLTKDEMPPHHHEQNNYLLNNNATASSSAHVGGWSNHYQAKAITNNTGGGQAHNNMPPYMRVYMWKRTA